MTVKSEKKNKKSESKEPEINELEVAQAQAQEYLDMARRLQADFDNFRKRSQRENEEFRKYAAESLIVDLLGVVDDMDRALAIATEDSDFVTGIRGVRQNLMKVLETRGLKEVPTDKFNPDLHEALCIAESDTDGDIAEVFQKGYCIGDRVIRYAKVKVTKKKEE